MLWSWSGRLQCCPINETNFRGTLSATILKRQQQRFLADIIIIQWGSRAIGCRIDETSKLIDGTICWVGGRVFLQRTIVAVNLPEAKSLNSGVSEISLFDSFPSLKISEPAAQSDKRPRFCIAFECPGSRGRRSRNTTGKKVCVDFPDFQYLPAVFFSSLMISSYPRLYCPPILSCSRVITGNLVESFT